MFAGIDIESVVAAVVAIGQIHGDHGRLLLRAGIAQGDVLLLEGDDYVGRPVNLAARLCDHAAPGQILASREGLRLPNWVLIQDKLKLSVRGFAKEVPVATLGPRSKKGAARESWSLGSVVDGIAQPLRALMGGEVR